MVITYITQRGDNKEKIKRKLSHDQFEFDNLLLEPKQLLHVPKQMDDGLHLLEYYTRKGDTLKTISESFDINQAAIEYFNPLSQLYVCRGQTISFLSAETNNSSKLLHDNSF